VRTYDLLIDGERLATAATADVVNP